MSLLQHLSATLKQHAKSLSLVVACSPLFITAPSNAQSQTAAITPLLQQTRHIEITAQPLASALLELARQSGIQIIADHQLLSAYNSPAVNGELSTEQALNTLLKDSDLSWRHSAGNSLTIEPAPKVHTSNTVLETPDMLVTATEPQFQGEQVIDQALIERMPSGNGDLTSLLKLNPNVQFDNAQMSSKSPGEIAPANVSINGAKFYQNAFLLDGMSMNNDINPADTQHSSANSVPGRSQGLAIDTNLLESITVYDSNVGAQYGGFNGGVIEANTRKPSQDLHGKISYQTTRSTWTRYHVDESQQETFESAANSDYQPEFAKHFINATLEGHLTENFGLLANVVEKSSTIPVHLYTPSHQGKPNYTDEKQDQTRKAQNFFVKANWSATENLDLEASLTYAPEEATYFRDNALDTAYTIESGGTMFNLKSTYQGDSAVFTQQFAISQLENSRDSSANDWHNWATNEWKNWGIGAGSTEGGYGNIEQSQKSYQYKLVSDWESFDIFNTTHSLQTGIDLQNQNFTHERLSTSNVWVYGLVNYNTCNSASTLHGNQYCDEQTRQYLKTLNTYALGNFSFDVNSASLFFQDKITLGNLTLRPGLRYDQDSYMSKKTLAPRFALEWDAFGDQSTRVSAGRNRYYGRNSAQWALREGVNRLRTLYNRVNPADTWKTTTFQNDAVFSQLDIPYDDEWTLGLTQRISEFEVGLKWVRREGRDQVVQEPVNNNGNADLTSKYDTYSNKGRSNTEVSTLTLTPLQNLQMWGTKNTAQLAADWRHHNTNHNNYTDDFDEDNYVRYQGSIIHKSDFPPTNYNREWTYRLTTNTEISAWNINWTNFIRYQAGLDTLKRHNSKVDGYIEYYDQSYSAAINWDMRLAWEIPTGKNQAAFVNVDIYNVTDRINASNNASEYANNSAVVYETGRQFWLEVGYRF